MDCEKTESELSGKREINRLRNRSTILLSARECFRDKGYENTTIRDIVRQTGLAAGTFYNYFSSKQDIFVALLSDFLAELNRELSESRRGQASAEQVIYSAYAALFRATAEDPLVYELAHHNDRAIRELFGSDIPGLAMMSLADDIEYAVSQGLLPDVDQDYLSAAFTGLGYEMSLRVAHRARRKPEAATQEARNATRFATDLLMKGLQRQTSLS